MVRPLAAARARRRSDPVAARRGAHADVAAWALRRGHRGGGDRRRCAGGHPVGRHQRQLDVDARRRGDRLRHVRDVRDDRHLRRRRRDRPRRRRPAAPGRRRRSRGLRPRARRRRRRRGDGGGQRPDRAVPRAGDDVAGVLRAGGQQPAAHEEPGERDEVLHPRRVLVGVLPLRHRPRLRLDRLDEPRRRSSRRSTARSRSTAARRCCSPASPSSSSGSGSRSPPFRSTSGRPTSTRERRRRSPR